VPDIKKKLSVTNFHLARNSFIERLRKNRAEQRKGAEAAWEARWGIRTGW
jgi:hypothetical protein